MLPSWHLLKCSHGIFRRYSGIEVNSVQGSFFLILIFDCYSITVVWLFSPSLHPTLAKPSSLPHFHPPPWFCPCVLYSSSCNPLSSLSPPHSPLSVVRLFLTSMSMVIFCFLFFFFLFIMFQLKVRKNMERFTNLRVILAQGPC